MYGLFITYHVINHNGFNTLWINERLSAQVKVMNLQEKLNYVFITIIINNLLGQDF